MGDGEGVKAAKSSSPSYPPTTQPALDPHKAKASSFYSAEAKLTAVGETSCPRLWGSARLSKLQLKAEGAAAAAAKFGAGNFPLGVCAKSETSVQWQGREPSSSELQAAQGLNLALRSTAKDYKGRGWPHGR